MTEDYTVELEVPNVVARRFHGLCLDQLEGANTIAKEQRYRRVASEIEQQLQSVDDGVVKVLRGIITACNFRNAHLVGSFARGDYDEDSDVDVLVEDKTHSPDCIVLDGKWRQLDVITPDDINASSIDEALDRFPESVTLTR